VVSAEKKISELKYRVKKRLMTALVAPVSLPKKTFLFLCIRAQGSASKISLQVGQTG
jgi:hypothetical protein